MSRRGHGSVAIATAAAETVFAPPAIELIDVRKSFGKTVVLSGVGLRVESGERVAIIGPNGAGKSSLFDLISGSRAPTSGEIHVNGQRVDGLGPKRIAKAGLARSFQVTNLFPRLTVRATLRCAISAAMGLQSVFWRDMASLGEVTARSEAMLERLGLTSRADVVVSELGYADQRALEIGVALAADPSVLLLDEPTAGMSQSETRHFTALIRELVQDRSLLVVEHDMSVVFELADRVAVLVQGAIIACDTPARVRANARVQAAYLGESA